jgi:hypothetical protein
MHKLYSGEDVKPLENYLDCCLAYALGDEQKSAEIGAKLEGPMNQFQAAVSLRDHHAAEKALTAAGDTPAYYYWLLMLTAQSAGDTAAAETYFAQAVEKQTHADRNCRDIARLLASNTPADHAKILRSSGYAGELRVLFTALGLHYPEYREQYFARARALDHEPSFPHLLLASVRGDSAR